MSPRVKISALSAMLLLSVLIAPSTRAERPLLSGSLGQWLSSSAAPQLAETLSRHPKFKGEKFKFVTLHQGHLAATHNNLTQAIAQELRHHILRGGNNNIVRSVPTFACPKPAAQTYLLGLQIDALGRFRHKFTVGVIDADDGDWLGGVSLNWKGRLLASERDALNQPIRSMTPGTIDNPLPRSATDQAAQLLMKRLQCRMRDFAGEEIYLERSTTPQLQLIEQALLDALTITPVPLTDTPDQATSRLAVLLSKSRMGLNKLSLTLRTDATQQHLGHVYVRSDVDRVNESSRDVLAVATPSRPLIAAVEHLPNRRCAKRCAHVRVLLNESAHVSLLQTHAGKLIPTSCRTPVKRQSGEISLTVNLPAVDQHVRAHTGLYVIATSDDAFAEQLNRMLKATPETCAAGGSPFWQQQLLEFIQADPQAFEWRAMHFKRDSNMGI